MEISRFKKNKLAHLISLSLLTFSALAEDQDSNSKDEEESSQVVLILGSHIQGTDTGAANPVSVISAEDMQFTSAVDVTDMLNVLSVNSGAENRPDTFTSFYNQGTSNINLRGLGLSSTLVLIN